MTDSPDPLVTQEVDIRDFAFTPIFRARLFGSSFHARASDAEWRAGVTLWLKSWDQVPAGSLPDDDIDLCRLAELGRDIKVWRKIKAGALHGWFKCSDGRLYHQVVSEGVNDAWDRKRAQRDRTEKARAAKLDKRVSQPEKTPVAESVTEPVTDIVTGSKGQGQGQGQGHVKKTRDEIDTVEKQRRFDLARSAMNIDPDDPSWSAIHEWIRVWSLRGADFEADVLATVVQMMSKKPKTFTPRALNYFDETVQQNFDARIRRAEAPAPQSTLPPAPFDPEAAKWEARIHGYRENDAWDPRWGPEPGQPGCQVPPHLLIQPVAGRVA